MRLILQGDAFVSVMRRESSAVGEKKKRQPKLALAEIWEPGLRRTEDRKPAAGHDRGDVATTEAERGVSIEHLDTEIQHAGTGKPTFKVHAQLLVPAALSTDALRQELGALGQEMTLDIALDDRPGSAGA